MSKTKKPIWLNNYDESYRPKLDEVLPQLLRALITIKLALMRGDLIQTDKGLCLLQEELINNDNYQSACMHLLTDMFQTWSDVYECSHHFPINGYFEWANNQDKWNPDTEEGKRRALLLDYCINQVTHYLDNTT